MLASTLGHSPGSDCWHPCTIAYCRYGQLSAGNVLVKADGCCALSDLENGVLNLPGFYHHFIVTLPHLRSLEQRDVYVSI
jgi:hypothetical protein